MQKSLNTTRSEFLRRSYIDGMTQISGYRHSHLLYGGRVTGNNRIRSALEIYFRNVLRSLRREIRNEENAVFCRATHAGVNRIRREPRDRKKQNKTKQKILFVHTRRVICIRVFFFREMLRV